MPVGHQFSAGNDQQGKGKSSSLGISALSSSRNLVRLPNPQPAVLSSLLKWALQFQGAALLARSGATTLLGQQLASRRP